MFNFIKKAGTVNTYDKDDREKRKREKKEKREKQKRDRSSLSAEEILRLDEFRKSLKLGRRKEKEKLPSGITADYTADFLASLERDDGQNSYSIQQESPSHSAHLQDGYTQSDSSETSLNSLNHPKIPPALPPKPPKRGILKTPKIVRSGENGNFDVLDQAHDLVRNTLQNEVIEYQNFHNGKMNGKNELLLLTSTSPSGDSLSDTTNSSFATPPFSMSPIGESQGYLRWNRTALSDDSNLPLPPIVPLILPPARILKIPRQKPPRNDFGFSLRRAMVLERVQTGKDGASTVNMKAVIFAEPGVIVQNVNETGLLPGDKLLEVNEIPVEDKTREEIIDMIKASDDFVTLKVQPVAELSELSQRSGQDGGEIVLDDSNIKTGTLRRSGSCRFKKLSRAKSEEHLQKEKQWLETDKVWFMHRNGFTLATKLNDEHLEPTKVKIHIDQTGETLIVDEDDLEIANPPQFDRVDDLIHLRHLNESSILHTLRQRYAFNLIHTYASNSTLIVINPMAPLAIYSEKVVSLFKGCKSEDMPPHIYSITQSSYHGMLSSRRDQSLVFLGRSGSGKTTNFRHAIQYLVTAAGSFNKTVTVEKLAALWTVLENFGNCKTILNTNATRFTQIFSLDFDQSGAVVSASIQVLLLEKSRIVKKLEGETPFHIIQRLLCGVEGRLRKELFLDNLSNDISTNHFFTTPQKHEERQRAQTEFIKVCSSMNILGIGEIEQKLIFTVLAAIYHLGNAGVVKTPNSNRYQFANPQAAQKACTLLGTNVEELSRQLFSTGSGGMVTPNAPRAPFRTPSPTDKGLDQAVGMEAIEGIIIGLYSELFNCVIHLLNRSLSAPTHTVTSILLVDCPGFQNPATCGRQTGGSFDDLCHNYLQERLQLLFHQTNLIAPKDRYIQENIEIDNDDDDEGNGFFSNPAPLVNLLDKTAQNSVVRTSYTDLHEADRRGLLWLLDEESIYPCSNDETFIERLFTHYGDRDHQLILRKGAACNQFMLHHFQGTNPVLYTAKGWLKCSRENPVARIATNILLESCKEELSKLFVNVRGLGGSNFSGSSLGLDGSQSLRRASSIRRTFGGNAAIKRKSVCLQTKFIIDGLVETLRRTRLRFVQCILPCHDAATSTDVGSNLFGVRNNRENGSVDGELLNVPLLRSQIRGVQILETTRFNKQGYPNFMPLGEFRRKFRLLCGNCDNKLPNGPVLDEKKTIEDMLQTLDLESSSYRVGLSLVFLRNGVLSQLEAQRDECLGGMVVKLQARCRGYLARKRLSQRKLQDLAVRCIQRNVRKFMLVRDWPWWRLLVRVTPLLNVHRTEEKLKLKTEELEVLRSKLEKLEQERNHLKHENEKLEAKMSDMTADLAEEHSAATLASERLEAETSERLRLEKELNDVQCKNKELNRTSERLEMELLYARSDMNNGISEEDDEENGENGSGDGGVYKKRYERVFRELEFTKRRLKQQHEDDLEQLIGLKKQLEKKLNDAYEEAEEQRQVVGQWKNKVQKLNGEMNDLKLLLEEQNARNNLLEKKQRRFDSETQNLNDELKKERNAKERILREKEVLIAEKYSIETTLADIRLELELKEEKLNALQREYDEITCGERTEEEVTHLRRQKIEMERRLQDQEEELDELASQVQLLEQAKLRLEMTLESMRKEAKKEAQLRDDELEEMRGNAQKRVKALEAQLENEHEERTLLLRQKHELERRLASAVESDRHDREGDEVLIRRLKNDLRKTKALLRDCQTQLDMQKADAPNKSVIRQLKNQLEDLECSKALAVKLKQSLESELAETQAQLEESNKMRRDAEEKSNFLAREKGELQSQLEENEEELAEVFKKYKAAIQQMSLDQMALQEQVSLVSELEVERNHLKDQLAELTSKLESAEYLGDSSSNLLAKRNEFKVKELESKLDLEQSTRSRLEVQISRLKETVEKLQNEVTASKTKEHQAHDQIKKLQRALRETKEELNNVISKEIDCSQRKKDLEKKLENLDAELASERNDLKLAKKRIEDLQLALQGELGDSVSDHSESDPGDSDDSVDTYLPSHRGSLVDARRFDNLSRSSTSSSNLGKEASFT